MPSRTATYDPESWYYRYEPGTPLQTVIDRWQKDRPGTDRWGQPLPRQKVYDDSMPVMLSLRELWPLREYTWTRENSRGGFAKVNGKTVELPGPLKWDAIKEDMRVRGWDPKDPLHLEIGVDGGVKVGEGNHRLALARELGIDRIPVWFDFKTFKVQKQPQTRLPIPEVSPKAVERVVERAVERLEEQKTRTPEEQAELDRQVEELMKLLKFGTLGQVRVALDSGACRTEHGYAWISPEGKVHLLNQSHYGWAIDWMDSHPGLAKEYNWLGGIGAFLEHGWLRVANATNISTGPENVISDKAWKAVADLQLECVREGLLKPEDTVYLDMDDRDVRFTVGDFARRFVGRKQEDAVYVAAMARVASFSEERQRILDWVDSNTQNGQVRLYREVIVPPGGLRTNDLGVYWTPEKNKAHSPYGRLDRVKGEPVVIEIIAPRDGVDDIGTVAAMRRNPGEREIRLLPGTQVQIVSPVTGRGKAAKTFTVDVGQPIWYGKYKNKKGVITEIKSNEKGDTIIVVEQVPNPTGRKQPKEMKLFKVRPRETEKTARVPVSDSADDVARGIRKAYESWWRSPAAKAAWERETEGPRRKFNPMPFEEWRSLYEEPGAEILKVLNSSDSISVEVARRGPPELHQTVLDFVRTYAPKRGWFVKTDEGNHLGYQLMLEARRGDRVDEISRKLYHVTQFSNVKSILRRGLLPRKPGEVGREDQVVVRRYPERIYLAKSRSAAVQILGALFEHKIMSENSIEAVYGGNFEEPEPWVIFEVDTAKLRPGTKFYRDPDFSTGGVYTLTPIPAAAVRLDPESAKEVERYEEEVARWEAEDPWRRVASAAPSLTRLIGRMEYSTPTEEQTEILDGAPLPSDAAPRSPAEWGLHDRRAGSP
jgi:hypothetical protein